MFCRSRVWLPPQTHSAGQSVLRDDDTDSALRMEAHGLSETGAPREILCRNRLRVTISTLQTAS